MAAGHLRRETLERWLAGRETEEDRCEAILHLAESCPECRQVAGLLLDLWEAGLLPPVFGAVDVDLARARFEAPRLWQGLTELSADDQRATVERDGRFRTVGVVEVLSRESRKLAGEAADRAVKLAELAVLIAEQLQDDLFAADWLGEIRALAWSHLGNALRAAGDLLGAEKAFSASDRWWGEAEDALGYEPILLDLKASLRCAQSRFPEAIELLERAIDLYKEGRPEQRDPHQASRSTLKKGLALLQSGETARAVEVLRDATRLLDAAREPRLLLVLKHNLLSCLVRLGRLTEAQAFLPEVRSLGREVGSPLDALRLRWIEGRLALGLGERETAEEALREVRLGLVFREIAFDAALVSLELAALLLESGRTTEVKEMAREMVPIFLSQEIHREALAALAVFQSAALLETATAEMARQVAALLDRSRSDRPALL
jgi:tetratricopeptide (TPR) repeat protein